MRRRYRPLIRRIQNENQEQGSRGVRYHLDEFKTWGVFIAHCQTAPSHIRMSDRKSRGGDGDRNRWSGGSWDTACRLAREGWPEGLAEASDLTQRITEKITSTMERFDPYYDLEPGALDVARYLDSEPECWLRMESVLTRGPGLRHVTIVVNMTISAGIKTETITRRGAALASLVECLEYAGHRAKVQICEAIGDSLDASRAKWYAEAIVTVKEFDEALDLDRVAFALAHPSVQRRFFFAWNETLPAEFCGPLGIPHDGYGSPVDIKPEYRGDIYLTRMLSGEARWHSPESAEAWVREELTKQGVVFSDRAESAEGS